MLPRLITLTLNPALDLAADADAVVPTHKIRMHHEHADAGGGGVNVAILTPGAFREHRPSAPETWRCVAARTFVELTRKDVFVRETLRFERGQFEIEGALPHPGL